MPTTLETYAGEAPHLVAASLPEGADALVLVQAVRKRGGRAVFVARDDTRARTFRDAVRFYAPDIPVLHLPAWDCLPYDRVSPSRGLAAQRAGALHDLLVVPTDLPLIIVTTVAAVTQKVPPREALRGSGFSAKVGQEVDRKQLETYLSKNGYARAGTVIEAGDFAVRGGVVDCFPPGADQPLRLDFFGDELESIRSFDVETQLSDKKLTEVKLAPVSEVFLNAESISAFRKNYIAAFGGGVSRDPVYAGVSDGIRMQGVEHYLPLFYEQTETVFDYAGPDALYAFDGLADEARIERWDLVLDFYESRRLVVEQRDSGSGDPSKARGVYRPLPTEALYLSPEGFEAETQALKTRAHTPFLPEESATVLNFEGRRGRSFSAERKTQGANVFESVVEHIGALKTDGRVVLLASWTDGSSERLGSVLSDHGLDVPLLKRSAKILELAPGTVHRVILPVEEGFDFGELSIISEQDVLGDRLVNRQRKRRAKNFIAEASALQPNDLVVHIDHGLGRFTGLITLDIGNAPHDCLEIHYAGDAKLFLPVENIELLSRYGSAPETVMLDKLGGVAWQSRKAKAKQRLRDMADGLIKIAAKRMLRTAEPIDPPAGSYEEFCARFPFAETDDQLNAIADVIGDLESGRPMDRLICGDVGFGKTEVALRAAFLVAMSGKQVAIVAPTTILARQHFKVFSERFRGWPVNVRQLSRLVTGKQAAQTKEQLANGRCEIVVGTHAVLAKSVNFSDIGLMIIDEEQRFGVKHKERLKEFRADVHVLTLTATPIPRTLQMALSGIRDLSIIATPPVDRLAVRTYVSPFDEVSIRKAILREKYRGGQSFFIAPRIADLPRLQEFMEAQVPEVKTIVAHGQMPGRELEDIMTAFYDGQYDVLLSTSISRRRIR
jgi:transcription-repair coupling factor (superfamily II helicase)